jgi:hypothetical protein
MGLPWLRLVTRTEMEIRRIGARVNGRKSCSCLNSIEDEQGSEARTWDALCVRKLIL